MDYYIRFYTYDGYERLEPAGDSLPAAIEEAERMSDRGGVVEVVDAYGGRLWTARRERGDSHDDV